MLSRHLVTPLPGPRAQALLEQRAQHLPRGIAISTPVFVSSARNALITDVDGNTFIDFAGGIGALNVGHRHPRVVAAIEAQLEQHLHTCVHVAPSPVYLELAALLNRITPGSFPKRTFFANSGAEGVENAVKVARYATGRSAVVAFTHAFHGRTLMGMSLTSKVKPYKDGFGPFAPEVYRVPYPYCLRCPARGATCCQADAAGLRELFATGVAPERVAAVVIEPVLGEGGFVVPPPGFLQALAALCRAHGIVLIADEVQTGFGRTGALFACEHEGIEPDLLVMSKSLGGGTVLSAVTGRAELMDAPPPGALGGTFGGNPLSLAAALATVQVTLEEDLPARARELGTRIESAFRSWQQEIAGIGEVRGRGAMWALELVLPDGTPDKARAERVVQACYQRGLLILTAGTFGNTLRTLMPLTTELGILDDGLQVLREALDLSVREGRVGPG